MNSSFKEVLLGDICNPKQWKTLDKSQLLKNGYPVYGANGKIGFYSTFNHQDEVIAITCRGATCGNITLTEPYSYVTGNSMCLEELSSEIDIKFLYYYLFQKRLKKLVSGSAQPQITRFPLQQISIHLPPLTEQKKITEILSGIDRTILSLEKQRDIIHRLRVSLLNRLVNHALSSSSMRIPLDDLVVKGSPICYGILMPGKNFDKGIPVIKVKDIIQGTISTKDLLLTDPKIESKFKRSRLSHGDILISIRGTTGRTAIVPKELEGANITQDSARVRIDNYWTRNLVRFFMDSLYGQKYIKDHTIGQAVKGINLADLRKMPIPSALISEDYKKLDKINIFLKLGNLLEQKLLKVKFLRSAIQLDLLSGRKRVNM